MRNTTTLRCLMVTILVLAGSGAVAQPLRSLDSAIERKIDSLLRMMTMEEKLGQLNQITAGWDEQKAEPLLTDVIPDVRAGRTGSFLNLIGVKYAREIQRVAIEESRLKIPLIFGYDVIHGFRTIFPIPLGEAASWDTAGARQAARVAGTEAAAAGVHWTFAPMVDICRDPRWGRIMEGSGEDPHLGSAMAIARVQGFQGDDLRKPENIVACAKHFAAYGGAEAGRDYNVVDMSERTLREIYLPPYKAAVDAGVGTLMSSFNEIGGVPSTANRWLMTNLLRGEWGFRGFVVSDWTAVEELQPHRVASNREQAGLLALNAGVDMDMAAKIYANELVQAYHAKKLSDSVIDESVRRVLRVKHALGLFENPYRNTDTTLEKSAMLKPEYLALARRVAQKSIVLLKNDKGILPLKKEIKTIAVIGPLAADTYNPLGGWNGRGSKDNVVSVLEGIKAGASPNTKVVYAKGCEIESDSGYNPKQAVAIAKRADVAVLVVGESMDMSGEASSRSIIDLPGRQRDLINAVAATGKPVVLVLMNGRPLTLSWEVEHVPAIVEAWFPGVQAGNAVADVLFGNVNPGGKLPVTFPRSLGQIPIYYNYKSTGRPMDETNKYTSKYLDVQNTPLYPFGFGLSYTTFSYSNLRVSSPRVAANQELKVSVDVTNTGSRAGDEVVQMYLQDEVSSVTRPVKELKGFKRISLNAGEKKTVEFVVKPDDLAFYGLDLKRVVEPGWFKVFAGGSSADVIETRFELK